MSQTPPPPDLVLLDRYLAGEATPGEQRTVEAWLDGQPHERRVLTSLHAGMADPYGPVPPYDVNARVAAVVDYSIRMARRARHQSLASTSVTARTLVGHRQIRHRFMAWYGVFGLAAAAIVIALGWAVVGRRDRGHSTPAMIAYTTGNGQRAAISLTDGSTVLLNVASRLEVPADYAAGDHTVRLMGEALFTVTHRTGKPFTVLSGGTAARVLGTSFVVRRYGTDTTMTVAVRDGKVAVGRTVVPAASYVEVGRGGVSQLHRTGESQFDFVSGVLMLHRMSLSQAIPELNRWYDADVRLGDPTLASQPITGQLPAGSLVDLSEMLKVVFNVRVVRDGRTLTLYPR